MSMPMLLESPNRITDPTTDRAIAELRRELREVREELRAERERNAATEAGVRTLRVVLTPLYQGLQHIFGEMDALGVNGEPVASGVDPRVAKAWQSWKDKLGGLHAKAIDALMLHGEMTRDQLRIQVGCATRTISDVISKLNTTGLIEKRGGKISLKEL